MLGFLLNNEMDDFASKPGTANMFGLVQGEANAIQPGKRPLSSMTPTIVLKDGKLFMTAGAPGGSRISTAVLQVILNVVDFGMNVQDAIDSHASIISGSPTSCFSSAASHPTLSRCSKAAGTTWTTHRVWCSPRWRPSSTTADGCKAVRTAARRRGKLWATKGLSNLEL